MNKPLKVFITYAHKNRKEKDKLITCLDVMRQEGLIDVWHDNEILAGDTWKKQIFSTNLPESDLLLYLISSDSLASENCNKELAEVLTKKDIRVIFIIFESCDWKNHKLRSTKAPSAEGLHPNRWEPQILGDIQVLPAEGKPLNEWNPRSKGWQNVVEGTRKAVRKMLVQEDSAPRMSERELRAESAFQQGDFLLRLGQIDGAIEAYSLAVELNPRDTDAYNNRGVAYNSKGEYGFAIKDFNQAIQLNPGDAAAYNNRGTVYVDKDEVELAIKDFNHAIRRNPNEDKPYNNRGIAYHKLGEYDLAIKDFNAAIELRADDANAYYNRGNAYCDRGNYDRAIKDFNTAIKHEPDFAMAYNNRGMVYSNKHDIKRAIKDFTKAIDRNSDSFIAYNNRGNAYRDKGEVDQAIKDFNTAIQLNPGLAEPYNNRGAVYYDKGNYGRAIKDFNMAIKLKPDYANAYNNRGVAYRDHGEINRAIDEFNVAIKLNPYCADPYNNRGIAYHEKDEVDRAIKDFNKAIQLNPNYANAYNSRGIAYDEQGKIGLAVKDYNTAIKLNPDDPEPYNNRGTLNSNKGEHDRAIEDFSKAIARKQNYAAAYSNRGGAYRSKGENDRAIIDCTRAIELEPWNPAPYNNRGAAYRNKGEIDRAIKDYNKAIELKPNCFLAYHNRAIAYYQQREFDRAIKDYSKVIELNPALAVAYNNRGVAYYKNGEYNRAIEEYDVAIKRDYANAYYNRAEVWLHLKEWDKAKADLITAKKKGVDIGAAFRNDYKNIAAFERANQVKLPEDIAMLVRQGFRNRYPMKEKAITVDEKSSRSLDDSPEMLNLEKRLRDTGTPLGEYIKTQPFFGIKTAPTDVFVVDGKTRDKLIAEHPSSEDILKPILHGRDIRRWQVEPPEQWLIFAYRGIEINAYPAIRRHLEKHRDSLSKRKGKGGWYELQASVEEIERYAVPKLVCPNLYNTQTFAVEADGYFCGSTCYIIPTEQTWLCGLLNTRTVEWFYYQVSDQSGPGELQARSGFIKQIPVPDLNAEQKNLVRKIVEYLIYLQNQPTTSGKDLAHARDFLMLKYFERIINGLFYEFYMPDVLQGGNRDLFKHLMAEQLSEVKEIHGDKMFAFRALYERLYHKEHPVRVNLFFQDSLRPIRIIEDKW